MSLSRIDDELDFRPEPFEIFKISGIHKVVSLKATTLVSGQVTTGNLNPWGI